MRRLLIALGVLVVLGGAVAVYVWHEHAEDERRAAEARERREREAEERRQESERYRRRLQEESGRLMPQLLGHISLGMDLQSFRAVRTAARPTEETTDDQKIFWAERFPNGAQAMYGFDKTSMVLTQIQVMSRLPTTDGISPHLAAMNEQYGTPTGVWDCPNTGGVPTRRFTWRKDVTAISDVFLIHPGGVSLTLYIAPSEVIHRSLMMASCHPVESSDDLEVFPVASPEQIQASQKQRPE